MSANDSTTRNQRVRPAVPDKLAKIILGVILVAALGLRLYALDAGLWLDEILTYVQYARMPFLQIISTYPDQNQHFLYSLMAHASFLLFGESNWALRLPAVLFGVASIGAMYLFAREVTNRREALLASALLAFSYQHIWFSQNARGYSGVLFWTLLASYFFLRALDDRNAKHATRLWVLYAASCALGVYTHLTMIFVIAAQFLIYLAVLVIRRREPSRERWRNFILAFGLTALFTLLLHAPALPQILTGKGLGEVSTIPEWTQPLWTVLELVRGLQIGFTSGVVALAAVVVFGAGAVSLLRTRPIVLALFILPCVLCAALIGGLGHHLWPRFFYFALGVGALIVIHGAMVIGTTAANLLKHSPSQGILVGTALCVALILFSATSIRFVYAPKQDYLGARAFIEQNQESGDAVVTVGLVSYAYQQLYKTGWTEVKSVSELNAIREHAKRTWLLYTFPPEVESVTPDIAASLPRDFKPVTQFYGSVGDGTIFVYRADNPSPTPSAAIQSQ
ncbi:MAG TPA: glycosyltransferase family 39 protein [Anaerolineae bacterium]|nr:glycosyltransferase family 39 protein [Anaerolineae bacterium]